MTESMNIEAEPTEPIQAEKPLIFRFQAFVLELLQTILLCLVIFVVVNVTTVRIRVENISMRPTLHDGEYLLINRLAYRLGEPKTGDIIVFYYPRDRSERYIKRVIGLPGDQVRVTAGQVYVNDEPLNEPYIAEAPAYEGEWVVPPDSLFVMGDNRNNSSDSHNWGFVPYSDVIGTAALIYWPLGDARILFGLPW